MKRLIYMALPFFLTTSQGMCQTRLEAVRLVSPVHIDGRLDDAAWQQVPEITGFLQRDPDEGKPATQKTIVRLAYDNDALYVAAHMQDTAPDSIMTRLSRRDDVDNEDQFAIAIDSYHDHRSGYFFGVSAGGTLMDGVCYNDDWTDDTWDGVWEGCVHRDSTGWSAELRIPFSQLRFEKKDKHVWGINFLRAIGRRNEESYLVYTPKGSSGFVSRFPHLNGIEGIHPGRNIEILPYTRMKASFAHPESNDPFHNQSEFSPDVGGDFKISLSNNLTLDMTVNPDFGQVEVDPAVVNLSDVETFYDEKRPFFIEGASTYEFGYGGAKSYWGFNWSGPQFFYSRRIGQAPQGEWPDNDYADVTEGTHILGAAKLTGKLDGNWNVGTLHAVTRKETGSFQLDGKRFDADVEPITYYGLFRTQREINGGRQGLGVISTLVSRKFETDALRSDLNDNGFAFGVDGWSFLDTSKTWVFTGWLGASRISGTSERMVSVQENSRHYFQRPDAGHLSVDSSATELSGYAGRFYLNKQKGRVIVNSAIGFISPGFDVNDIGYVSRADWINGHLGLGYLWTEPGKVFRWADIIGAIHQSYDFEGNNVWGGLFLLWESQFLNYMRFNIQGYYNPETYNKFRTRGGPLTINEPGFGLYLDYQTDDRKPLIFDVDYELYQRNEEDRYQELSMEFEWKPKSNIRIEAGPEVVLEREPYQWVDVFDDATAGSTYGKRYVFGKLKQTEISANIRFNWTFSPRLSLQLYVQPLVSYGEYTEFKELSRPKSNDYRTYTSENILKANGEYTIDPDGNGPADSFTFDNPNFNYKSLRGNAVLRWEYRPGSTLYFVWTQNRWDDHLDEPFGMSQSMERLVDTRADNIFMLKATYWWSL